MKTRNQVTVLALLLALLFSLVTPHAAFAQGPLTPPGAPAPLFKTRTVGCYSCFDPDAINEDGEEGDCVNCEGDRVSNRIVILHQDGTAGDYRHFKKGGVLVSVGQRVYRGTLLGKVGNTGCSTNPHLHFHVLENQDSAVTIPIKFETYDEEGDFRPCYVPPHDSVGRSTNMPVF